MSTKVGAKQREPLLRPVEENKANGATPAKQEEGKADDAFFSIDKISPALAAIKNNRPTYSQGESGGIWRIIPIGTDRIAGACYDRAARIWNFSPAGPEGVACGKRQCALRGKNTGEVFSLLLRDTTLITGSCRGKLRFWNSTTGTLLKQGGEKEQNATGFYSMADIGDGRIVSGACQMPNPKPRDYEGAWNYFIKIWSANLTLECQLAGHTGGIPSIHHLGGNRIVSCSADKTMRIWDLSKKESIDVLQAHKDYIYCMGKVSNEQVLSGSRDRTIKLWDLTKGIPVSSFTMRKGEKIAHGSTVYDLSVRGDCAVSGSRDGFVRVWDIRTPNCLKILTPEDGYVYSATFLPNGNIAAGTSGIMAQGKKDRYNAHVAVWDLRNA